MKSDVFQYMASYAENLNRALFTMKLVNNLRQVMERHVQSETSGHNSLYYMK